MELNEAEMKFLKTITASIALVVVLWVSHVNANIITLDEYPGGLTKITCDTCKGFIGGPSTLFPEELATLSDFNASRYELKNSGDQTERNYLNFLLKDIPEPMISTSTQYAPSDSIVVNSLFFSIKQAGGGNSGGGYWFFKNTSGGSLTVAFDPADAVYSHLTEYGPTAVPVPAAVWLFGSALLSLVGFKRKQAKA